MPVALTVLDVKTSYLALKYSSKKLIDFFYFDFQVTHPHCPSQSTYFFEFTVMQQHHSRQDTTVHAPKISCGEF